MLRHIVMWKIDTPDMDASYARIKESLRAWWGRSKVCGDAGGAQYHLRGL